ncbi:MAG TPA: hypothetical protein VHD56_00170 [Tepidisphaeraceae bacterium]|nr:hypothetical protein [Tepidisphaeraceae bacterium]
MDSSKLSIKLFAQDQPAFELETIVPVFHSWIQTHAIKDHLLIDVADYSHVHNGPGIVLVAHEANYSVDYRDGRLGLTYQRKQPLEGSFIDRIKATFAATQAAAALLGEHLKLSGREIEFRICDRLAAPNDEATFNAIKPELLKVWPGAGVERRPESQGLLTITINPKSLS